MDELAPLRLKKDEERRLRAGHLWVFSNEVDVRETPLGVFAPGQLVELQTHKGAFVGSGYVNPNSLICARLVSRDKKYPPQQSLLVHRLKIAHSLRERLYSGPYYRLVHGEADLLPGLVVDRFDDLLVVQLTTAGMEAMKEDTLTALEKVLKPKVIVLRNDTPVRKLEGLPLYTEVPLGALPEQVQLEENDLHYQASLAEGQKTGWYFDQRDNRARLGRYVQGMRVLDLYSYTGGWGVLAAASGAREVLCVDSSPLALEYVEINARLNRVGERLTCVKGDVNQVLRGLREARERFDVIVLDPPAFIKRKKDFRQGVQAYRRINQLAQQVLAKDGILVSCSCSFHMPRQILQRTLLEAAAHLGRNLQILEQGYQGPDHPVHPAIPETEYLKAIFCRLT